jgi:hypothetical protein
MGMSRRQRPRMARDNVAAPYHGEKCHHVILLCTSSRIVMLLDSIAGGAA